jgi:hypothetical protein
MELNIGLEDGDMAIIVDNVKICILFEMINSK